MTPILSKKDQNHGTQTISSLDAAGQCGENLPGGQDQAVDQCVPPVCYPDRAGGRRCFAVCPGCDREAVSLHGGPAAPGRVLVLPPGIGAGPEPAPGAELSPDPHEPGGAAALRPAGDLLGKPHCRGIFPQPHRRQRRSGVPQDPAGRVSGAEIRPGRPGGAGGAGPAGNAVPGGAGGQLPEIRRSRERQPEGKRRLATDRDPGPRWVPPSDLLPVPREPGPEQGPRPRRQPDGVPGGGGASPSRC